MLTLFQLAGAGRCPSLSPSCVKLETWLRMSAIPHRTEPGVMADAPKGKLPYIEDNGERIGDATLILDHLRTRYGIDLDRELGTREKMTSLAFRRLLKEHLYWILLYFRWQPDQGYLAYRDIIGAAALPGLPFDERRAVIDSLRPRFVGQLEAQGMGRHAPDEVAALGESDLAAIATLLETDFAFGDTPTTLDATVYAMVTNILDVEVPSPLQDAARGLPQLVAHTRRMQARFFPELSSA